MSTLSRALGSQRRKIKQYMRSPLLSLTGFGESQVALFMPSLTHYPPHVISSASESCEFAYQTEIDNGEYADIKAFDSIHSADIEFDCLYSGRHRSRFQKSTKANLIELGNFWRNRLNEEFPGAKLNIVVHLNEGVWFLDTYHYDLEIEGGIYL